MADLSRSAIALPLSQPWLLISDLDGTILDHWNYSPAHMMPLLETLEAANIPVVFNTSKTAAELKPIREELGNRHPFIVENGSAIYLPLHYFSHSIDDAQQRGDYQQIVLGTRVESLRPWLNEMRRRLALDLVTFSELSETEVAALTALSEDSAARARQRDFSEVIVWRGSNAQRSSFYQAAEEAGWTVRQGGRFLHLLGPSDKGRASLRLMQEYEIALGRRPRLIACGDGENDVDMLRHADLALLVRSPIHELPALVAPRGQVLITSAPGPEGLAHVLRELLLQ